MDQGLPVNFENTASTWQNMPMMAGFYTGLQNQSAQENIRMLQEAYAKEQAFKEQSRPFELQKLQGDNELQHAQALNYLAMGRNTGAEAALREGTLNSAIGAGNSKNATSQVEDKAKALNAQGAMYQGLATMAGDPNIPNFEKVDRIMKSQNLPESMRAGLMQNIDKLPKLLQDQANHHFQNDPATRLAAQQEQTKLQQTRIAAGASMYGSDKQLEGTKYSADARIEAAKAKGKATDIISQAMAGKMKYETAAAGLHIMATLQPDNPDAPMWERMAAQFEEMNRQAPAKPGSLDTAGVTGLPAAQTPLVLGGQNPAQPKPQHSLADVQKMYPGVPPEKLRQAYKDKFGVDLQ